LKGLFEADCIPPVLVPQIVDALRIPVVAGGGIADGRGMVAALSWGAEGVYMGTRFIATTECPAHEKVKQAIVEADDVSTIALRGILGMVRSLKTPLATRCAEMEAGGCSLKEITDLYHSGYIRGMLEGNAIEGTFICGAACGLIREVKGAATVVQDTIREAEQVLTKL
jgi:enoyl-[acyl-carrier protein] reductase II